MKMAGHEAKARVQSGGHQVVCMQELDGIGNDRRRDLGDKKQAAIECVKRHVAYMNMTQLSELFDLFVEKTRDDAPWSFLRRERGGFFRGKYGNTSSFCRCVALFKERAQAKYDYSRGKHGDTGMYEDQNKIAKIANFKAARSLGLF